MKTTTKTTIMDAEKVENNTVGVDDLSKNSLKYFIEYFERCFENGTWDKKKETFAVEQLDKMKKRLCKLTSN